MHDILIPVYDSSRIKYLTKVLGLDNENIIHRVYNSEKQQAEERLGQTQQPCLFLLVTYCFALLLCNRIGSVHFTCAFLYPWIFSCFHQDGEARQGAQAIHDTAY